MAEVGIGARLSTDWPQSPHGRQSRGTAPPGRRAILRYPRPVRRHRDYGRRLTSGVLARTRSAARRFVDGLRVSRKLRISPRTPVRLLQNREQRLGRWTGASVNAWFDCRGRLRNGTRRGLLGPYGTYDYFAPHDFRFSSTSFSFGTTLQAPLSGSLVVQSSGLVGAGYVAAYSEDRLVERNDHYGVAPQGLANLRLIAGRRAALDLTAREYYISTLGGFGTGQRDRSSSAMPGLPFVLLDGTLSASPINLPAAAPTSSSCQTRRRRARRSVCTTRSSARAASAPCNKRPVSIQDTPQQFNARPATRGVSGGV